MIILVVAASGLTLFAAGLRALVGICRLEASNPTEGGGAERTVTL